MPTDRLPASPIPSATVLVLVLASMLALGGCVPDDWNGLPYTGPPGSTSGSDTAVAVDADSIAGRWYSEGEDIAPLLANPPFGYVRLDAVFGEDGSYSVTATDGAVEAELTGSYTLGTDTVPGTVVLDQATPYVARAEGIWQIQTDGTLLWEVVQVVPDFGSTPPSPEQGFGSSGGPGMAPGDNVQRYHPAESP